MSSPLSGTDALRRLVGTRRDTPGWAIVARKEVADHLRSVRFGILLALLVAAGLGAVYSAAGGIREVAQDVSGSPSLFLRVFTVQPNRIPAYFTFISFMGPLLGIAFGFDAVNGERAQGTLPRLLSQPLHRDDVVNGKFVAGLGVITAVLVTLTMVVAGVAFLRLGVVPTTVDVVRVIMWVVVSIGYVGFWLALSLLCSVSMRRAATSALAALAAWLVLSLFFGLLVGVASDALAPVSPDATALEAIEHAETELALSRLSPTTLYEEATTVLLTPEARAVGFVLPSQLDRALPSSLTIGQSLLLVWPQIVGLLAATVVVFAAAYVLFLRQEIRA